MDTAGGARRLTAWFHVPGSTAPVRWVVRAAATGNTIERKSAAELP